MKCLLNYSNPLKIKFEVIETYQIENKSYSCLEIAFLDFREQKKNKLSKNPNQRLCFKVKQNLFDCENLCSRAVKVQLMGWSFLLQRGTRVPIMLEDIFFDNMFSRGRQMKQLPFKIKWSVYIIRVPTKQTRCFHLLTILSICPVSVEFFHAIFLHNMTRTFQLTFLTLSRRISYNFLQNIFYDLSNVFSASFC